MTVKDAPFDELSNSPVEYLRRALPVDDRDRPWIALAFLPGCVAVAVYLATNPYPAFGAGLYSEIAAQLAANGYVPPARIPGYTADGVPFAYPPLQFYLLAVLLDLGGDPVAIAEVLPSVGVLAALFPTYLLARDVTESRPAGTAAAAMVAVHPQILQWHISAGGVVRAFAFLYALTSIYAGYHVFGTGSRRAIALGAVSFGLTVLTHPTYALFVVVSYLVFWVAEDRSATGLLRGATVGTGGVLIAGPWLGWVVTTHGLDIFAAAAGTHGGIGGGADELAGVSTYVLVALVAAVALAVRREYLLPAWLVAAELSFQQPRFAHTVASLVFPAVGVTLVRNGDWLERPATGDLDVRALAAAVLVVWTLGGGTYLAYEMTLVTDPSTPEFLDDEAVEAMEWVAEETDEDATFVVAGDAAEWFPASTDRTLLLGPWGVEWVSARAYDRHLDSFINLSTCQSADCVETTTEFLDQRPDYVYVPKGRYTVRGETVVQFGTLERSFDRSPRWERAYENEGVVIYRAVGERADDTGHARGTSTPSRLRAAAGAPGVRHPSAVGTQ